MISFWTKKLRSKKYRQVSKKIRSEKYKLVFEPKKSDLKNID